MSDQEKMLAIQEGYRIHYCDAYFYVRPQIDCGDRRKVFDAGFDRGWEAASIKSDAEIAKRDAIISRQAEALKQSTECLHDIATGQGGWAYEEVISQSQDVMRASANSVAAWEAEHAAKVLEEFRGRVNNTTLIPNCAFQQVMEIADSMIDKLHAKSTQKKEGE